jgi:hypothetical protein
MPLPSRPVDLPRSKRAGCGVPCPFPCAPQLEWIPKVSTSRARRGRMVGLGWQIFTVGRVQKGPGFAPFRVPAHQRSLGGSRMPNSPSSATSGTRPDAAPGVPRQGFQLPDDALTRAVSPPPRRAEMTLYGLCRSGRRDAMRGVDGRLRCATNAGCGEHHGVPAQLNRNPFPSTSAVVSLFSCSVDRYV